MWVKDRKRIADRYIKGDFMLDVIAAFPYALVVMSSTRSFPWNDGGDGSSSTLLVVRALRLFRLLRVVIKLMRNGTDIAEAISSSATKFNPAVVRPECGFHRAHALEQNVSEALGVGMVFWVLTSSCAYESNRIQRICVASLLTGAREPADPHAALDLPLDGLPLVARRCVFSRDPHCTCLDSVGAS